MSTSESTARSGTFRRRKAPAIFHPVNASDIKYFGNVSPEPPRLRMSASITSLTRGPDPPECLKNLNQPTLVAKSFEEIDVIFQTLVTFNNNMKDEYRGHIVMNRFLTSNYGLPRSPTAAELDDHTLKFLDQCEAAAEEAQFDVRTFADKLEAWHAMAKEMHEHLHSVLEIMQGLHPDEVEFTKTITDILEGYRNDKNSSNLRSYGAPTLLLEDDDEHEDDSADETESAYSTEDGELSDENDPELPEVEGDSSEFPSADLRTNPQPSSPLDDYEGELPVGRQPEPSMHATTLADDRPNEAHGSNIQLNRSQQNSLHSLWTSKWERGKESLRNLLRARNLPQFPDAQQLAYLPRRPEVPVVVDRTRILERFGRRIWEPSPSKLRQCMTIGEEENDSQEEESSDGEDSDSSSDTFMKEAGEDQ